MATYAGAGRTSYFHVRDETAFIEAASAFGKVVHDEVLGFAVLSEDEGGALEAQVGPRTVQFADFVAPHLANDNACVIMHAGFEGTRFISGWAVAVAWDGRRIELYTLDIYRMVEAQWLGVRATHATPYQPREALPDGERDAD